MEEGLSADASPGPAARQLPDLGHLLHRPKPIIFVYKIGKITPAMPDYYEEYII